MKFTLNNVLSILHNYRGKPYISSEEGRKFTWASLLPDTPSEMKPDILYICLLSKAMTLNHMEPSCSFVCIVDRYLSEDDREDKELLKNIILIDENRTIPWLLDLIQGRFRRLEEWEQKMKDCIIAGGNYQDLFDISEIYLENSLFALDSAYRLIASSKIYRSSDPMNVSLYEKGYYTADILEKFYKNHRLSAYKSSPGMTICKPGVIAIYESYAQWCRQDNMELVQIVEVFSSSPATLESPELFSLLMKYVMLIFNREQKSTVQGAEYSRLLQDMLAGNLTDTNQINESAKCVGIPIAGKFDAWCIKFKDSGMVLPGRFISDIMEIVPNVKIFQDSNTIHLLNNYGNGDVENNSLKNANRMKELLTHHGAYVGISAPFYTFADYPAANSQAESAITYSLKCGKADDENIFVYKDILLYHIVNSAAGVQYDAFYNNPFSRALNNLKNEDLKNGTNLYDILFIYLKNERKATQTAAILHMHRNTVMYHVQRISEILKLDLDDYSTRQGLLLSFHFLEMKNGNL